MRYLFVFVFLLVSSPTHAGQSGVRPADSLAAEILARATRQSATVRSLIDTLEATDVIVHVEVSWTLPSDINGMTRFVVSRSGYRYVRITIPSGLPLRGRTAILAHELQHAVEVARSDAHDVDGLRQLFEREGRRHGSYFETPAALDVERHVRSETRTHTLQAEPVVKFHH